MYFCKMILRHLSIAVLVALVFTVFSCSEYNKVMKSDDLEWKYEKAKEYYEDEKYFKAYPLIEELITYFRGTARAEELHYLLAYADYHLEDYMLAGHRFKQFVKTYPRSDNAEECAYMSAYSTYLMSPRFSLDQDPTYEAIDKLDLFIKEYPNSDRADTCSKLIAELETKLEYKSYMAAKQYFKMEDYRAAYTTFGNLIKDYPDSKYHEEALFHIFRSHYELTVNSVEKKKGERTEEALKEYVRFADKYPESEYMRKAETMYEELLEIDRKYNIAQK